MPLFSYLKSSFPKPSYEYFSKLILCNNTTGIDDHAGVILVLIRHIQMIGKRQYSFARKMVCGRSICESSNQVQFKNMKRKFHRNVNPGLFMKYESYHQKISTTCIPKRKMHKEYTNKGNKNSKIEHFNIFSLLEYNDSASPPQYTS